MAEIVRDKRKEVKRLARTIDALREKARSAPPPAPFMEVARRRKTMAVIAEIKRRSPSKGPLAPGMDPTIMSRRYEAAGAAAVSVLTDGPRFGGSLEDMTMAARATRLPVLRKDFVVDPLQLLEARGAGASLVLLIARILTDEQLESLRKEAERLGMTALVEAHTAEEIARASRAGARLIGINNRDLSTFATDLSVSERLARLAPRDAILICESGIRSAGDVQRMARAGAHGVLVGEALVRDPNPEERLRALAAVPKRTMPWAASGP